MAGSRFSTGISSSSSESVLGTECAKWTDRRWPPLEKMGGGGGVGTDIDATETSLDAPPVGESSRSWLIVFTPVCEYCCALDRFRHCPLRWLARSTAREMTKLELLYWWFYFIFYWESEWWSPWGLDGDELRVRMGFGEKLIKIRRWASNVFNLFCKSLAHLYDICEF